MPLLVVFYLRSDRHVSIHDNRLWIGRETRADWVGNVQLKRDFHLLLRHGVVLDVNTVEKIIGT
jgi:hypothetical protein